MKKVHIFWGIMLALILCFPLPVSADTLPRVNDEAELMTVDEEALLEERIAAIGKVYQFDVVIVTEDSFYGKSATAFVDDYFDDNGYGYGSRNDGILFAIAMDEQVWAFSTTGRGIDLFSDPTLSNMEDEVIPHLSSGDYVGAFSTYVSFVEDVLESAEADGVTGNGVYQSKKKLVFSPGALFMSAVAAFAVGLIVALILKGKLKTARPQPFAGSYVRQGSFSLRRRRDIFLYSHTSRTAIPKNTSPGGGSRTHTGSSGVRHGGSSGRF